VAKKTGTMNRQFSPCPKPCPTKIGTEIRRLQKQGFFKQSLSRRGIINFEIFLLFFS